jgi:hypothetical protein
MLAGLVAVTLMMPRAGVALASTAGATAEQTEALLVKVDSALRASGLEPRRTGTGCRGERECLVRQLAADGLDVIVSVSLAVSKRGLAIDLESISPSKEQLAQLTSLFSSMTDEGLDRALSQHARTVASAVKVPAHEEPQARPPPPDRKRLEPALLETTPPAKPGPPRWAVATSLGAGVLLGLTSTVIAVWGFRLKADAERLGPDGLALYTEVEAQRRVDEANARFTTALVLAAAAAGLAVVGLVLGLSRL